MGSWEMPGISGSAFDSQGSAALPKGNIGCLSSPFSCFISHLMTNENSWDLHYICCQHPFLEEGK